MRLATFGDLHLGPSTSLDKFRGDEDLLLRFSDHLELTHDRVVLLGDIFQTDYGSRPGSCPGVLEAVMARYPRIVSRWLAPPYELVYGNHDLITGTTHEAVEELRLEHDGWRMWLIHGHQFDPLISRGKSPYRVTWAMGRLRTLGFKRLPDLLEGPVFIAGQKLASPMNSLEGAARAILQAGHQDVVVMGHSHRRACDASGAGVYVNPGAGTPDRLTYASIDARTRVVELRVFQRSGGHTILKRWQAPGPPRLVELDVRVAGG